MKHSPSPLAAPAAASAFADVIVARPARGIDRPFTYRVPPELAETVRPGAIVRIPFHRGQLTGYVVALRAAPEAEVGEAAIKDILEVRSGEAFWGPDLLRLASWMQEYYGCLMVDALHAIIPEPVRAGLGKTARAGTRTRVVDLAGGAEDAALDSLEGDAAQARRLLATLRERGPLPPAELLHAASAHPEVLRRLKDDGMLRYRYLESRLLARPDDPIRASTTHGLGATPRHALDAAQQDAVERIVRLTEMGRPAVVLLHGVTGSGKTEVYLNALEAVMARGRSGLVLVPEISLTPQAVHRYRARLGDAVAVLHSALTPAERFEHWWRLKRGAVPVALGARSCVFAPLADPALIIVDEEHDGSYKQESPPRYHARQIAVRRAMQGGGVVVLGSATPAIESYHWAREGRYHLVELPGRVEGRALPAVEIVDLRRARRGPDGTVRALGSVLRDRMRETLIRGEQVMLLMNRRGFCSYLMCTDCGHLERCPRCDISLTYHVTPPALLCHYCLYERRPPAACPSCGGSTLRYFGSGTQRVEEELREAFPTLTMARMDADTTRHAGDHRRILERFGRGEVQLLLGTQMIAKGHDFPGVTLVGVILADTALNLPDFRSAERTFSLLTQVAGRAGRGNRGGQVVIQTYNPENLAVQCAARQDYRAFFESELAFRRELSYPPFSRLVNVVFTGEDETRVREAATGAAAAFLPEARRVGAGVLGPAPCAVARIHRKYRWHLTFKAHRVQEIAPLVRSYLETRLPVGVHVTVDADPVSML